MIFPSAGVSLRTSILGLLVGVILLSTGLVAWISFSGSQEAVRDVGLQLRKEISHRISEHLLEFLSRPHEINRANAQALSQGLVSPDDPRHLVSRFAHQVDLFPSISSVYFGNARGGLANSGRDPDQDSRYCILTDGFRAGAFRKFALDRDGKQGMELARVADFDARTRPWYKAALAAEGPVWSDVYVLFTGQDMALAASRRVSDASGRTLGVVSVDVFLSQLSHFLQGLRIGSTGEAFIMERSGLLVAGSGSEPLFVPGRNGAPSRRLEGAQSSDPVVHGAVQALTARFGSLDALRTEEHLDFTARNGKVLMTVSPLRDPLGIDWLIIVAIPEADFMAGVMDKARTTATSVLGVLALSLVFGALLAHRIARPISRLDEAADRLARGYGLEELRESSGFLEVRNLTRAFNRMVSQLSATMQDMQRELGERQRAEEALSTSETRHRTLVELAVDGILLGSHDGYITEANQCMCDLLGLERKDLIGRHVQGLPFVPESLEQTPLNFGLLQQGEIVQRERSLVRSDGRVVHVEMRSKMMPDGTYQSIYRDVTARRLAEEALRESEERLRLISDNLPGGLVYQMETDVGGGNRRLSYVSAGVELLHEVSVRDVLDDVSIIYAQVVPEDQELLAERQIQAEADWSSFQAEVRFRLPSGAVRWGLLASAPRMLSADRIVWDGVEIDITEQKRAEAALREAKDSAEEANRVKSEFLANMSHEIRTPLNGILGMMQLLHGTPLDGEQQRYVRHAISSAERLTRLLSDILDIARIEAGKLTILEAPFEVGELVDSVAELFAFAARDKGLSLECFIHPDLPARLLGDEARIRQILFNLVGNALKYTESGGVTVRLEPSENASGSSTGVSITVSDTGVGIPEDMLAGVFEPFSQVEGSHSRRYEGAGLGLAIVRRLADLMAASIDVRSAAGQGTTVRVALPLKPAGGMPAPVEAVSAASGDRQRRCLRILLAEDEAINQLATGTLLRRAGHDVRIAENGREVLALILLQDFDCILMDVQMPVMSGVEATRRIRNAPEFLGVRNIPIIALTAHAMSGDRESFLAAGMNGYLSKPVRLEDLAMVMDEVVRTVSREAQ